MLYILRVEKLGKIPRGFAPRDFPSFFNPQGCIKSLTLRQNPCNIPLFARALLNYRQLVTLLVLLLSQKVPRGRPPLRLMGENVISSKTWTCWPARAASSNARQRQAAVRKYRFPAYLPHVDYALHPCHFRLSLHHQDLLSLRTLLLGILKHRDALPAPKSDVAFRTCPIPPDSRILDANEGGDGGGFACELESDLVRPGLERGCNGWRSPRRRSSVTGMAGHGATRTGRLGIRQVLANQEGWRP